jgi:hypothetical protein
MNPSTESQTGANPYLQDSDDDLNIALELDWTYHPAVLASTKMLKGLSKATGVSLLILMGAYGAELSDPHRDIPLREREVRLNGVVQRFPAEQ